MLFRSGTAQPGVGGAGGGGGATINTSTTALGGGGGGTGLYGIGPNGLGGTSYSFGGANQGVVAGNVQVQAANYNASTLGNVTYIKINNVTVPYTYSRGHTVMVLSSETLNVESAVTYDTYGDGQAANAMNLALQGRGDGYQEIKDGQVIVITSFDATGMPSYLRGTLRTYLGSTETLTWDSGRYSHAFVGIKQPYNSSGNPIDRKSTRLNSSHT